MGKRSVREAITSKQRRAQKRQACGAAVGAAPGEPWGLLKAEHVLAQAGAREAEAGGTGKAAARPFPEAGRGFGVGRSQRALHVTRPPRDAVDAPVTWLPRPVFGGGGRGRVPVASHPAELVAQL